MYILVGITGVQMVSITTQMVYYAGHLYDVSYLPASPLAVSFVSLQNHRLTWDCCPTTVRLCTVELVLVAMVGIGSEFA